MPTELLHVISRHVTSEGVVTYARSCSGELTVWLDARPTSALLIAAAPPSGANGQRPA